MVRNFTLILLTLIVASRLTAQPQSSEPTMREAIAMPMIAGSEALQKKRYVQALANLRVVQATLDQRPMQSDKYDERIVRAAAAFLTAKALGEGKLGNPCPSLSRARSYINSLAELVVRGPSGAAMDDIAKEALHDIAGADVTYGCAKGSPTVKASVPAALAGHYYLSGVMETGSELLLKPDGSYDYFISYGAVDQFSKGHWRRVGDAVVLTHAKLPATAPLFKLDSLAPWDADAEGWIQKERYEKRVAAIYKRCPFLGEPAANANEAAPPEATAMTPPALSSLDPPKADLEADYRKAKAREASARRAYESAASRVMRKQGDAASNWVDARMARYDWQQARYEMLSARNRTDLSETPPMPQLPAACVVPDEPDAASIPEKRWIRGFAIVVADPATEMNFKNVDVTFQFADGTNATRTTVRGGIAWVEKQAGNPVTGIVLNYRGAGRDTAQPEHFAIAAAAEGVQHVVIDSLLFAQPPFDEMRLTIDRDELIGPGGRGRYARAR